MTSRKELFCGKCKKITPHEHIRDGGIYYWRCEDCVIKALKKPLGIFVPPHSTDRRKQRGNYL